MSEQILTATWRDVQGNYHGLILTDPLAATAVAPDRAGLRTELAALAIWLDEHAAWRLDTDWERGEQVLVRVQVRARYSDGPRAIPLPQTTALRIPCVKLFGANSGLEHQAGIPPAMLCVVPHLRLSFVLDAEKDVRDLVPVYVQEAMRQQTPNEIALQLPPLGYDIESQTVALVRRGWRKLGPDQRPELRILFDTSEPLLRDRRLLGAAFGRTGASTDLVQRLQAKRGNILLVGPRGVGKSTLLVDAARKLASFDRKQVGNAESDGKNSGLADYRLWRTNAARLIAGMRYLGQWEARVEQVITALGKLDGILVAENLIELVRGDSDLQSSVGAFLVPYLQRGELRMVAEASFEEVQACRRLAPQLLDCFEQLPVTAFTGGDALKLLQEVSHALGSGGSGKLDAAIPAQVLALHQRFLPQSVVPGPAVQFIRELAQLARTETVDHAVVIARFSTRTGLPTVLLRDDLPLAFESVCQALSTQVIGQRAAVEIAAQTVITVKAGLNDPQRPIAALLLSGPTGTGKTALAKALAHFCFGAGANAPGNADTPSPPAPASANPSAHAPSRLIRLDMSEYAGYDAMQRFLGDGQVQAASWLQAIARQPFSVLLFDEIEKASPDIFDALLGLLDEGRLTDRFGQSFDFKSAIILMTSNLGAKSTRSLGFVEPGFVEPGFVKTGFVETGIVETSFVETGIVKTSIVEARSDPASAVQKYFRPEFFNRLDAVVPFFPLGSNSVRLIVEKELQDLQSRAGLAQFGLTLRWDAAVVELLAQAGIDPRFGARPIQRSIEQLVVRAVSQWRLEHPTARQQTLGLTVDTGQILVRASSIS